MEVRALFGRFVWRGVNIDDVTIHPSRGSRINATLKQDSTTVEFRFICYMCPAGHTCDWDTQGRQRAGKWRVHIPSCPIIRRANGAEVPFHTSIIDNFVVYKHRLETHLLQLLVHPENSEWFSIIFVIIFEVNIAAEQKQA